MSATRALFLILAGLAFAAPAVRADPMISETFSGYPDNALINVHPAGPAVGLTGDWTLAPDNNFYVNRTQVDFGSGTGKAVYDMPADYNGARTAERSTSSDFLLFSDDGDTFYASFLILPARADGTMSFGLVLEQTNGGGQPTLSFGMDEGHFVVGNGGVNVDVTGGAPNVDEMLVVFRLEYGDSGGGPDDLEVVTVWVDPVDESSTPVIDQVAVDLLNRGGGRVTAVQMRGDQMDGQPAYFDNLRVGLEFTDVTDELPAGGLSNDLGVNGLFYDPNNSGHGFNFVVHGLGLTIMYYGHTVNGERLWLISDNVVDDLEYDEPVVAEMYEVVDGVFGSPQSPPTVWGTITVTLVDCDTGHASFDGIDGTLEMDIVRLTGMPAIACQ
jgi:hypothetical protein